MIRTLSIVIVMFIVGCGDRDAITLKLALTNTEKGDYNLIAIAEESNFVSFQKSSNHKKQYHYPDGERDAVLKKVAEAVKKARKKGHEVATMGLHEHLQPRANSPHKSPNPKQQ